MSGATFPEALRAERARLKLSVRDLARRCGVTEAVVRAWEAGEAAPPTGAVLARLLGSCRRLSHVLVTASQAEVTPAAAEPVAVGEGAPRRALRRPRAAAATIERAAEVLEGAPPAPPETFGAALTAARAAEGLQQWELGALVGVTGQAVSAWERDAAVPVDEHYRKLLDLFPPLVGAPTPAVRQIDPPDGGRGLPRDAAPPSTGGPIGAPKPEPEPLPPEALLPREPEPALLPPIDVLLPPEPEPSIDVVARACEIAALALAFARRWPEGARAAGRPVRADSLLELAADPGLVALAAAHPDFLVDYAELLASGASLGLRAADVARVLAACVD